MAPGHGRHHLGRRHRRQRGQPRHRVADRVRPATGGTPRRRHLTYPDGPATRRRCWPSRGRAGCSSCPSRCSAARSTPPRATAPGRANRMRRLHRSRDSSRTGRSSRTAARRAAHLRHRSVYTFPGFERVGTVELPAQRQGEGISARRPDGCWSAPRACGQRCCESTCRPRCARRPASERSSGARPARPRATLPPGLRDRVGRRSASRSAEDWGWIARSASWWPRLATPPGARVAGVRSPPMQCGGGATTPLWAHDDPSPESQRSASPRSRSALKPGCRGQLHGSRSRRARRASRRWVAPTMAGRVRVRGHRPVPCCPSRSAVLTRHPHLEGLGPRVPLRRRVKANTSSLIASPLQADRWLLSPDSARNPARPSSC